jgi:hypothetical protein
MANIPPLQLSGPLNVPKLDWRPLDAVGDAYMKNQDRHQQRIFSESEDFWDRLLRLGNSSHE